MSAVMGFMTAARLAEEVEFDRNQVSPGVAGFLFTGLIAIGVILLGFDLVRRLRRNRFREEIRETLAAEIAERDALAGIETVSEAETIARAETASDTDAGIDPKNTP